MTSRVGIAALAIGVLQTACDPPFRLAGSVRDTAGAPISGADVRVECPDTFAEATSDSAGHFVKGGTGWCPTSCTVEVTATGRAPWSGAVIDHCAKRPGHLRDACLDIEVDVVLGPAAASPSPPTASDAGR